MKNLLGGKGANLAEMTSLGLPVPFGFSITTETCLYYLEHEAYPQGFQHDLDEKMAELEHKMGKDFGSDENPLLVSVRSGARVSMPGMMDTVLNLGLNDKTVKGMINKTGNARFSFDAYRRFVAMFGNVVMGMDHHNFEEALIAYKEGKGYEFDTEMSAEDWMHMVKTFKGIVKEVTGKDFPEAPLDQLNMSIDAVFKSWNNKRAIAYRNMNNMPHNMGTAVSVQAMVFGNMGESSGTGVAFTRNPSTGAAEFFGELLFNAQGEDVVAGIRTPQKLITLKDRMPEIYDQLFKIQDDLEKHYRDMQDIEFTIEEGVLYLLQTRTGKRTAQSAVKIAVDMVAEGMITKEEALMRIEPKQLNDLLHPSLDPKAQKNVLGTGLPASPGAAVGRIVFTADNACQWVEDGKKVILVRKDTSPEDIHGMHAAEGILTSTGGMTSHAAVVARGMGKTCIAGCKDAKIDVKGQTLEIGGKTFKQGDLITLEGGTGEVIDGEVPTVEPELFEEFEVLMGWADEIRTLQVRTNADTPHDAEVARKFGAEGIGLCRTEHMFFDEDRIMNVRQMILTDDADYRAEVLEKLRVVQVEDFKGIFKAMDGLAVTVRLLDPPLHEFLPHSDKKIAEVADEMKLPFEDLKKVVESLHEYNPMLGRRGCRLGITMPGIYDMQVRAIFEAAKAVKAEGVTPIVEIEVPLVSHVSELKHLRGRIEGIAAEMAPLDFKWKIGTMIEIPRACVTADHIAKHADFFSFGTNDLTQMSFGMSRDDAGSFLRHYMDNDFLPFNPTERIDEEGVGALMQMAVKLGRQTNPDLEIGVCGEHGGEKHSIAFCHKIGLDYVSCSPYRVPVARLAAAQAALRS